MKRRRVHNKLIKKRIYEKISEVVLYTLYYICPVVVMLLGFVATYNLLVCYGYNHNTGMWNINNAFLVGGLGLFSTIVLTFFSTKIFQFIADTIYKL